MWWFAILYFVNAVAPHYSLIYNDNYRIVIGGLPLNILDGLIVISGLVALIPKSYAYMVDRAHPAWVKGLIFLFVAFVIGVVQSYLFFPDLPARYRLPAMRNFILVPVCLYIGYRCLSTPRQIRTVFLIVFISSLGSAVGSILNQGQATAALGEASRASGGIDSLRLTALNVAGDAGLLAMSTILFAMAAGLPFLRFGIKYFLMALCAAGMFLIPHRSSWLLNFLTLSYAGLIVWPHNIGRKLRTTATAFGMLLVVGMAMLTIMQSRTDRDFMKWTSDRLASLLPGEGASAHAGKAWDTRLPGMFRELELWAGNPLFGRGFAAQEGYGMQIGYFDSFRHTPWVSTLCETGLPGLAGFGFTIVGLMIGGMRLARQSTDKWNMLLGAVGASYGFLCFLYGFVSMSWNSPRAAITLGLLAGIIFRARDMSLASGQQSLPLLQGEQILSASYE